MGCFRKSVAIVLLIVSIPVALLLVFKANSAPAVHAVMPETTTFTNASQLANYLELGYFDNDFGPISITEATLDDGTSQAVYLVTLRGWEPNKFFNNNGWTSCMLAGNNRRSTYFRRIKTVISENIPAGASLVIAGHSLGGMVAEQLIGDNDLKENYKILYTVTYGSPIVAYKTEKEGILSMLGDGFDPVIGLSMDTKYQYYSPISHQTAGIQDGVSAHMDSYLDASVWGNYDAVGQKGGTVTLTVNPDTRTYYEARTWS